MAIAKLFALHTNAKNMESENPRAAKTNKGKLLLLSKCSVWDSKKADLSKSKKLVD